MSLKRSLPIECVSQTVPSFAIKPPCHHRAVRHRSPHLRKMSLIPPDSNIDSTERNLTMRAMWNWTEHEFCILAGSLDHYGHVPGSPDSRARGRLSWRRIRCDAHRHTRCPVSVLRLPESRPALLRAGYDRDAGAVPAVLSISTENYTLFGVNPIDWTI